MQIPRVRGCPADLQSRGLKPSESTAARSGHACPRSEVYGLRYEHRWDSLHSRDATNQAKPCISSRGLVIRLDALEDNPGTHFGHRPTARHSHEDSQDCGKVRRSRHKYDCIRTKLWSTGTASKRHSQNILLPLVFRTEDRRTISYAMANMATKRIYLSMVKKVMIGAVLLAREDATLKFRSSVPKSTSAFVQDVLLSITGRLITVLAV